MKEALECSKLVLKSSLLLILSVSSVNSPSETILRDPIKNDQKGKKDITSGVVFQFCESLPELCKLGNGCVRLPFHSTTNAG